MPSLLSNLKSAREWATPTLKSSAFLSRGVLTPEEYVAAGDELVYKCPTWTWESGDPAKRKKHLPPGKQFLMTRGVPCPDRVRSMENVVNESVRGWSGRMVGGDGDGDGDGGGGGDDDDDDWLVSRILTEEECRKREEDALVEGFDVLDMDDDDGGGGGGGGGGSAATTTTTTTKTSSANRGGGNNHDDEYADGGDRHDDEYADMADFEDDDIMADEAAAAAAPPNGNDHEHGDDDIDRHHRGKKNDDNILRVRSYDVSITYDKYYQTPRVYLMGYADDGSCRPLTGDEMMEDVVPDYARRTVTVEDHPHLPGPHASIHPCQHGAVMKTIVRNLTRDDGGDDDPRRGNDDGRDGGGGKKRDGGGWGGGRRWRSGRRRWRGAVRGDVPFHIPQVRKFHDTHHKLRFHHGRSRVDEEVR